ncbi:hypothetical protein NC653_000559 [Populus alba x Populus x berolinensis]|uniref:protein-serine/threonine phosphatase n=1 Tax=Populus alba x Populus x berolinensis TaxID=444605 RepID=A0AAD6RJC4_9ROSI|nr:hypothetical protein NC653_000559 [Populus alba x Populus x berolinensis]
MGVYLSSPKTDKASQDGENDRLRYGLSSMQGWRTTMEDAHAAYPDLDSSTSFFGVYDGHGGQAVSKFCAKYLHEQVLKHESYLSGDLGTSLQKAFLRMDEMMRGQRGWRELSRLGDNVEKVSGMIEGLIWSPRSGQVNGHFDDWPDEEECVKTGQWFWLFGIFLITVGGIFVLENFSLHLASKGPHSGFDGPNCGSTACVAIIRNNQLVVANAGDSRCVISRKGQAYEMSKDHKPGLEVERERIRNAGGFIVVGRVNGTLNLSRAIGDTEFKQNKKLPAEQQIVTANPDIKTVELCDDDEFLVLACDGIWDCMSSQQLVDYVHEQLNTETKLSVICERVFSRCLAPNTNGGEGCDNMSMILVQFKRPVQAGPSAEQQPTSSRQSMEEASLWLLHLEKNRAKICFSICGLHLLPDHRAADAGDVTDKGNNRNMVLWKKMEYAS